MVNLYINCDVASYFDDFEHVYNLNGINPISIQRILIKQNLMSDVCVIDIQL